MVRNVAHGLLILLVQSPALTGQRSVVTDSCSTVRWSAPHALRVGGTSVFIERPAIISLRGRALLLGPRALVADSLGQPVNPLLPPGARVAEGLDELPMGLLSDGKGAWTWVPTPPRARQLPRMPRAAVDASGIAHVVWGATELSKEDFLASASNVWYARFDGVRWSEPERIATGHRFLWLSAYVSELVIRGNTLHLVVAMQDEGLMYLRAAGGHWSSHHVRNVEHMIGYPRIAPLANGRLVLLLQGASGNGESSWNQSAVFATWSDDSGSTWAKPVLVSSVEERPAYDFHLLVDGHDRLRAVWYRQTDSLGNAAVEPAISNSPGRVHIAESTDGGMTWRHYPPTALVPNADGLQVMTADDGSILVVLVDRIGERILLTSWRGDWRPFDKLIAEPQPFHPVFGRGDAQRLVLAWGTRHTHEWVTTVMTTIGPCR